MHDKEAKPWQDAAKQEYERFKERRNPSADAHGEPMCGGKPLFIVNSWAWAIRYRPSLCHRFASTYLPSTQCQRVSGHGLRLDREQGIWENSGMTIFESEQPLAWGELDVPLLGLAQDWDGVRVEPAAAFALVKDAARLWFVANHRRPATLHPQGRPGRFHAELWRYDVAELFLADPVSGRYFEFNLAPNGAWWNCEFTAPRVPAEEVPVAMPAVATFAELGVDGSWVAAMAIPLDLLRARLDFGPETRANVTFILETPQQRFLTAAKLGDGAPDFHRPAQFPKVSFRPLPPR